MKEILGKIWRGQNDVNLSFNKSVMIEKENSSKSKKFGHKDEYCIMCDKFAFRPVNPYFSSIIQT